MKQTATPRQSPCPVVRASLFAHRLRRFFVLFAVLIPLGPATLCLAQDIEELEEQAMRSAVDKVAPSVVSIETIGGLERVGQVLIGTGPTTGLIVSEDGYIISSAFNFISKPSKILVTLAEGENLPARIVARDHSRMLVLLKIDVKKKLPVPTAVDPAKIRVGQWSLAVGRTFEGGQPNVSVGIVSAKGRIFGKALQNDAKISPVNYGGPLVDIHGHVLGVLVPMSPRGTEEVAGVEWYDGGIGFAVPLADIERRLDTLKKGQDLHAGVLGVSLRRADPYATQAVIASAQPASPAARAGLKSGDTIVEVDGKQIESQMQLKIALGPKYAGDKVKLVVLRGKEKLQREIALVDKLKPYAHPFLGILPLRSNGEPLPVGITVRYVYPDGPAAAAGVKIGDRIQTINNREVADVSQALEILGEYLPQDKISLEVLRDGKSISLELTAAKLPTEIPSPLPPAHTPPPEVEAEQGPLVGESELKLPEFKNNCKIYVPETYHPGVSYGVVLWLHGGNKEDQNVLGRWKSIAKISDLIIVAPQALKDNAWQRTELEYLQKLLGEVSSSYNVDPQRVVVHGSGSGGAMAFAFAGTERDTVRAVAAVETKPPGRAQIAPNSPLQRAAIYFAYREQGDNAEAIHTISKKFSTAGYPVTHVTLEKENGYLTDGQIVELARWIDSLDRL